MDWLAVALVVVFAVNRGSVAVRLIGSGTGNGPTTTYLIWECVIMCPPVLFMNLPLLSIRIFYPDYGSLPFFSLVPSAST